MGDDFHEGKVTLPVVLAYRRGDKEDKAFWQRTMADLDQKDGDLDHAIRLLFRHGALDDTMGRARHYTALARDALDIFPASAEKAALIEAVEFCTARVS